MAPRPTAAHTAQAWVELRSHDPEAVSALAVAQTQLQAGKRLRNLRRMRLIEIRGALPPLEEIEHLLHRSIQFYNPHKEMCVVRAATSDAAPIRPEERAVLVFERGGERREAAERWWRHETGAPVEVREGTAWLLTLENGGAEIEDLALVRGRRHGLLCNPHSQECRIAGSEVPLSWIAEAKKAPAKRRSSARR